MQDKKLNQLGLMSRGTMKMTRYPFPIIFLMQAALFIFKNGLKINTRWLLILNKRTLATIQDS